MGFAYVYFCCQCMDGPKVYNVQPQCLLCNHISCANCKTATWNVNPDSPSANTEENHQYWKRKENNAKEDMRQAPHHRDQQPPSPKNPDYIRFSAPANAESIVPEHSGSYDIKQIAERIAFALVSSDYEIRLLCKHALEVNTQPLGILQCLLRAYGEELENTPGDVHTIAGQFLQWFPASTALAVVRSLDPTLINPKDIGEGNIPQHLIERYDTGSSGKADGCEESGLFTLRHIDIEELQRALVVGTASEHLRHSLSLWLHPNKGLGKVNYMLRDSINMPYRLKQVIDRWLRPGVKKGHMRAEWKCVCLDPRSPLQMAVN